MIDRLNDMVKRILDTAAFAARLSEQGLTGIGNTPEQFALVLRTEQENWTRLVASHQLSLE